MALTFGQLTSGAGAASTGMRRAEEQQRQARLDQLRIEEANRANRAGMQREASRSGLQVPNVPGFDSASGGQPFASTLGVPVPAAPPVGGAQASAVNMNVPQAQPIPPAQYPYFPEEAPPGPAPAASPAGRYIQEQQTAAQERNELSSLRNQVRREYGLRSGIGGVFVGQTDEERAFAKDVMDRVNTLTKPEIEQLLQTGQLPPKAGIRPELAKAMKQTESGGDTTAVSPKGATGLMQVMIPTAMDPGFGLPNVFEFAQQQGIEVKGETPEEARRLLKNPKIGEPYGLLYANTMSQRYGGDETLMLVAYNWGPGNADRWAASGRDPMQLPQETRDYIIKNMRIAGSGDPTIGKNPGQTADNVAKAAAAPATAGVMYGSPDVSGGGNPNVQAALMLRQTLAADYEIFNNNRMFDRADEALAQIAGIDLGLYKSQADQGIYELSTMGDASRAMSVLSQFTGVPTQALDRGDGTYDLYQNGRVTQTAVPVDKLADLIKTRVDAEYRAQKASIASDISSDRRKAEIEFGKIALRGNFDLAVEDIKRKTGAQVSNLGDGRAIITYPDGRMGYFDGADVKPMDSAQGALQTGVRPTPIIQ
jgi:soluble lytic murein transglycosylase-like protein